MRLLPCLLALFCLSALAEEPPSPSPAPDSAPDSAPAPSELPAATPTPPSMSVPMAPMTLDAPIDYGILVISRERLEVSTACDIGLYLQGNLTARLYQGQSVTLNLPPGEIRVRLGLVGGGHCQPHFEQLRSQTLQLSAGQVHRYRIAMDASGLLLIPAPQNY